jgi:hypothetical protein
MFIARVSVRLPGGWSRVRKNSRIHLQIGGVPTGPGNRPKPDRGGTGDEKPLDRLASPVYNPFPIKEFPMRSHLASVVCLAATAALLCAGGCSSSAADEQLSDIRWSPTPEVMTLTQRPADVRNQLTVTTDTNLRLLNRDLGVLFLLDRPSHLSPAPLR